MNIFKNSAMQLSAVCVKPKLIQIPEQLLPLDEYRLYIRLLSIKLGLPDDVERLIGFYIDNHIVVNKTKIKFASVLRQLQTLYNFNMKCVGFDIRQRAKFDVYNCDKCDRLLPKYRICCCTMCMTVVGWDGIICTVCSGNIQIVPMKQVGKHYEYS